MQTENLLKNVLSVPSISIAFGPVGAAKAFGLSCPVVCIINDVDTIDKNKNGINLPIFDFLPKKMSDKGIYIVIRSIMKN